MEISLILSMMAKFSIIDYEVRVVLRVAISSYYEAAGKLDLCQFF